MILTLCIGTILVSMALLLARAFKGPTIFDQLLAANSFNAKTVALILCFSILQDDVMYIDVALVYVIISFIAAIAFMHYFSEEKNNGVE